MTALLRQITVRDCTPPLPHVAEQALNEAPLGKNHSYDGHAWVLHGRVDGRGAPIHLVESVAVPVEESIHVTVADWVPEPHAALHVPQVPYVQ